MHNLSIGALFKNEAHCIKEWLDHYLFHGVEHFYLINDSSTDNFLEIIQPYIDKGIVTLFNADWKYYLGRQKDMYNSYIFPHLKDTKWLLMVDLDEFVWSPMHINLNDLLNQCNFWGQIQMNSTMFGSNGYVEQPKKIVESFTKCGINKGGLKYMVNSSFEFSSLNVHHATFVNADDEKNRFVILDEPYFMLNHYSCQSKNYWIETKMTRGDSDNFYVRTIEHFHELDVNEIEDTRLLEQNKKIESII